MTTASEWTEKHHHHPGTTHAAQTDARPLPTDGRRAALSVCCGELKLWAHNDVLRTNQAQQAQELPGHPRTKKGCNSFR